MQTKNLSPQSMKVIQNYLHLPFAKQDVSCPYYNNWYAKVRGGLRVLVGKGSMSEIVDETELTARREKVDLKSLDSAQLKQFLVDHNLGIDCSGLVYYILNAELISIGKNNLSNHLSFPYVKNPIRKIITKFRPVENINVLTLAHNKNSHLVALEDIQPSDLVVIVKSSAKRDCDHVLLVHKVDYENDIPRTIYYSHSLQWSTDGKYNHGVRQGKIEIIDNQKPLLEQRWIEGAKQGEENETWQRASKAKIFSLRRLNLFN